MVELITNEIDMIECRELTLYLQILYGYIYIKTYVTPYKHPKKYKYINKGATQKFSSGRKYVILRGQKKKKKK